MERDKRALVTREVQIMRKLQHENIVKYGGSFNEPQALYIVMQHLSGGSLYGLVRSNPKGRLSEASARRLFTDVAKGVAYLHSQSVVHRDLKLENMLLDDKGRVRLIDFGFASLLKPGVKCRMACGTPSYMPPEILKKSDYEGTAADMWSLGVVLYAMLHGCYPFKGQKPEELYSNISAGEYTVSQSLSTEAKTLLQGLLVLNPEGRLKAEQVLANPWLRCPVEPRCSNSTMRSASGGDSTKCTLGTSFCVEGAPRKAPNSESKEPPPTPSPKPSTGALACVHQTAAAGNGHCGDSRWRPAEETPQLPVQRQHHHGPQQFPSGLQQYLPGTKPPHSRFLSKVCEIFSPPSARTQRPVKS
ncbi:putative protein kinase [Cyclospora cayetanensis]|uniref:Protein kinase domain-containing protein n=2 Tax=Cyclospora cayetanensis TaxID=88456 RepID=A0A1D3D040_9EIME|nr:putative protein kinase [Cyclospora cayetanensis]